VVHQSVRLSQSLVMSVKSLVPRIVILSTSFLLWIRDNGNVHCPLLMYGASLGAYLMETIAWSIGIDVSLISQSKVNGLAFLEIYIQSSLAWICLLCVCAL